jgi:phage tail sheath protein FI
MDGSRWGRSVANAVSDIKALDTNYAATYYPWVKIIDTSNNKPTWVPPSVVLPGVISFTDQVAHEWFAPAGLNRGGLGSVLEAKTRLTHTERDSLYEGRVNPIASFPGQGVVVFGQKTLQGKPSALDRINVRRLLIRLRKFIASTSRYLVFEQNTAATRNRFLGIVNPFLESVQANSGLSAFKVVMDDSNNTPDVVDRNELRGQIFIQPTRTAEFIVLDFVVQPTGAAFPE